LIPLLFTVAVVALINGQTAGDESAGRLELFLSQPIDRRALYLGRLVACMLALIAMVAATIVVQLLLDALTDLSEPFGYVVASACLCGLLAAVFGSAAYLIACLEARPSLVLGAGIGLALASYVVAALFPIAPALDAWASISPWNWALGGDPLQTPSDLWRFAILAGAALLLTALGTMAVDRRDVAAP
jgi:ABC-2 type transport system permease protein